MEEKIRKNKRNGYLFYALAVVFLLFGLWQTAKELVIGYDLPEAALTESAWPDTDWSGDLRQRNVRVYLFESAGGEAAATAYVEGLFGGYKQVARLEPEAADREMLVSGTEEQFAVQVAPGKPLEIVGDIQQQSWFGMVVIDAVLCGVAFLSGRKQMKSALAEAN